jgi:hypothetical protein
MTKDDKKWNMQYEQLVKFKQNNGHCLVPRKYEQDKSLARWVRNQRSTNNNEKIRLDRKERLEEIGFAWKADNAPTFKPDDKLWHQRYKKLVEFKRKHGHCIVPRGYNQVASLFGRWVSMQRTTHINDNLRLDRKERLEEIGFAWKADADHFKPDDKFWHQQYEQLVEFKKKWPLHVATPIRTRQVSRKVG